MHRAIETRTHTVANFQRTHTHTHAHTSTLPSRRPNALLLLLSIATCAHIAPPPILNGNQSRFCAQHLPCTQIFHCDERRARSKYLARSRTSRRRSPHINTQLVYSHRRRRSDSHTHTLTLRIHQRYSIVESNRQHKTVS